MKSKITMFLGMLMLLIQPVFADDWSRPEAMDEYAIQIQSVTNVDGTVSVFYLRPDRELAYIKQIAPNSSDWTKSRSLDMYGNQFRIEMRSDKRFELFIIGTLGNVVTHSVQTAPGSSDWSKEKDLGIYASQLEVASGPDGNLMLFFLDMGKEIGYMKQTTPDSMEYAKKKMLDVNGNSFAIGNHPDGRIEVVNIGTLGNVLYSSRETKAGSGEFAKEKEIKGRYSRMIQLVNNADGALVLYYLSMDREMVYQKASDDGWAQHVETDVYGNGFVVGLDGENRAHIFVIGTLGNVLSYTRQTEANGNEWSKEKELKKGYGKYLSAIQNNDGKLNLFFIGMFANEFHRVVQE